MVLAVKTTSQSRFLSCRKGLAYQAAKDARKKLLYGPLLSQNVRGSIDLVYGKVTEAPFKYPLEYFFTLHGLNQAPGQSGPKNKCVDSLSKVCTYQKADEWVR